MTQETKGLVGQAFGRWTVIEFAGHRMTTSKKRPLWLCRCQCGTERQVMEQTLRSGESKSCGCLKNEVTAARNRTLFRTHGHTAGGRQSPTFIAWARMLDRCYNPKHSTFKHYGGRGITVCKEWRESFDEFLKDMGERPSPAHSLDRKDNSKGYSPKNCRWATRREQRRNTRINRMLEFKGERLPLVEWSERLGIQAMTIVKRLTRGWTVERALSEPVDAPRINTHRLTYKNKVHSLAEWSKITGLSSATILKRLKRGWSIRKALTTKP